MSETKKINVVAAVIKKDNKIFCTQRGYGDFIDYWEFPGGKIEPGEDPEHAIVREIREELDSEIKVESYLTTVEYDYPDFHLSMRCYLATLISGNLELLEHEDAKWLSLDDLDSLNWLPADLEVVKKLKSL